MLPLFPLNVVLFPGCVLDLQIFEARYLDMISACMKRNEGFGVMCIIEGEEVGDAPSRFSPVGCEALIRDWTQRENGLLGIRVEGGRRFEVKRAHVQRDQLMTAEVVWCDEPADLPLLPEHADLAVLLQALAEHRMVEELGMSMGANGQQSLSYQLAYLLPFEPAQKLILLAVDDPLERLDMIQAMLDEFQSEMNA